MRHSCISPICPRLCSGSHVLRYDLLILGQIPGDSHRIAPSLCSDLLPKQLLGRVMRLDLVPQGGVVLVRGPHRAI